MILTYKLQKDLCGRAATQLCQRLLELKSDIKIITQRVVNAKSLVGILSAQLKAGQDFVIIFDREKEEEQIKKEFNEVGYETNELLE